MGFKKYLTEAGPVDLSKGFGTKMPKLELNDKELESAVPFIWNLYIENGRDVKKTFDALKAKAHQENLKKDEIIPGDEAKKKKGDFTNWAHKINNVEFIKNVVTGLDSTLKTVNLKEVNEPVKVSPFWQTQSSVPEKRKDVDLTKEPKVNYISTDKAHKISFKKIGSGGSRIFIGNEGEAYATFAAALLKLQEERRVKSLADYEPLKALMMKHLRQLKPKNLATFDAMTSEIESRDMLNRLKSVLKPEFEHLGLDIENEGDVKKFSSNKAEVAKVFTQFKEVREMLMNKLAMDFFREKVLSAMVKFFSDNEDIRTYFTFEALTGEKKFEGSPDAVANELMGTLVFSGQSYVTPLNYDTAKRIGDHAGLRIGLSWKTKELNPTLGSDSSNEGQLKQYYGMKDHEIAHATGEEGIAKMNLGMPNRTGKKALAAKEAPVKAEEAVIDLDESLEEMYERFILEEGIADIFDNFKNWFERFFKWIWAIIYHALKKGIAYFLQLFNVELNVVVEQNELTLKMLA